MSVGLFRSGSKIEESLLLKGFDFFKKNCELKIEENGFVGSEVPYFAGNIEQRLKSVTRLLQKESIEFLWGVRGGYGTVELLPYLSTLKEDWKGKKVLGFSDITALHAFLSNIDVESYHSPMIATKNWIASVGGTVESVKKLFENKPMLSVPLNKKLNCRGRLVGGNLTVLSSLMGTPWQLTLKEGDILFLEDINEPYYAISRSLKQLSHSPNFFKCVLCWGELFKCASEFESEDALIQELMLPYKGIFFCDGLKAGHGEDNYCLPMNRVVEINGELLHCEVL